MVEREVHKWRYGRALLAGLVTLHACTHTHSPRARTHTQTQKYVILIAFSRLLVVTRTRLSCYFFASFIRSTHSPVQYEITRSLRSFGRCKRSQTHGGVAASLSGISTWILLWTSWHWTGFSRSISLCAKSEFRQCSVLSLSLVCLSGMYGVPDQPVRWWHFTSRRESRN